jgi:chemotaxis protein MotA
MKKLDRMTPIAVGGALAMILVSMTMDGSNPAVLFKPAPMLLVFGGSFLAASAGFLKSDVKSIQSVIKQAFGSPEHTPGEDIEKMVHLAETARREGLLALDKASEDIEDPFFRKAVQLTVDGNDPDEIQDILESEISALKERHRMGTKFFADLGGFAPTLGILGTVIGLIHVLGSLSDPDALGPAIASAFTATLWGVGSANLFWLPISNKLKRASELEINSKRMILEGLLAVQAGNSPRVVLDRLQAYLPPKERVGRDGKGSEEAA